MSCNACQSEFSFFRRDIGCSNCGFSYCMKCLKYEYNLPNVGVKKVCTPCYAKLNVKRSIPANIARYGPVPKMDEKSPAPIDITMKLDSLENPAKPPVVIYKHISHWDNFKQGLEPIDQKIVERLQKLKNKDQNIAGHAWFPLASVDEIRQRLALLKDQDPETARNSNVRNRYQVDVRTDQQKTDDLLEEYLAQIELSSANDPCKEIQQRLDSLRDEGNKNIKKEEIDDDEKTVTKKLINKAVAEAMLEAKYERDRSEEMDLEVPHKSDDDEEKPTCVMCEQTANLIQCTGCSNDLYCPACFDNNHDDFEMGKHKAIRFHATKMRSD